MKRIEATIYHRASRVSQGLAYLTAFVFIVMAVAQLFDFEKTLDGLTVLLPVDMARSVLPLAAVIAVIEVFALPYFLPVPLSKLARWCALVCAVVAPVAWMAIMVAGLGYKGSNVPIFGSIVHMPLGIGPFIFMLAVLALVISSIVRDQRRE